MNNIAIDVVKSNNIQSEYDNRHQIKVAMPADAFDDDTSNNSKKSRKTLLKKMLAAPPKLDKYTTPSMTSKAMANVYQNLSEAQQEDFLDEIANQNGAMAAVYNSLPDKAKEKFEDTVSQMISKKFIGAYDSMPAQEKVQYNDEVNSLTGSFVNKLGQAQRDEFLSKFGPFLQKQLGKSSVSASDKLAIKDFIEKINKYVNKSNANSGPQPPKDDFDDSGITNIMMILVKIFCQAMNVESMDMLQQIQDMKFTNKFLDQAKKVLEDNIAQLNTKTDPSKKTKWLPLAIIAAVFVVIVLVIVLGPEILADTGGLLEAASEGSEGLEEGAEGAEGAGGEAGPEGAGKEVPDDGPSLDSKEPTRDPADVSPSSSSSPAGEAADEDTVAGRTEEDVDEIAGGENDPPKTKKQLAWQKATKWQRFRSLPGGDQFRIGGKTIFTPVWKVGKYLALGAGAVFGSQMIGYQYKPDLFWGPAKQENATELQKFSQTAQLEGTIVDQMNNKLQTSSKNEGNDSDKISQFAQFVNQAINMFGQSFVTK